MTKTIRLSEWVTPGDTAIPGMTSLKDGNLQHSSVHIVDCSIKMQCSSVSLLSVYFFFFVNFFIMLQILFCFS